MTPDHPFLTEDLPGTGGSFASSADDFRVEEIPLYAPCGSGDHVYFEIEKRGISTEGAVRKLANALQRSERDFGCAGRKDARAVTRQWLSLEHADTSRLEGLDLDGIRIRSVARHANKLKTGHLAGNRFEIALRGAVPEGAVRAEAILKVLSERGMPNYYGPQRFGAKQDNHVVAKLALAGDFKGAVRQFLGGAADSESPKVTHARLMYSEGNLSGAHNAFPHSYRNERILLRRLMDGAPADRAYRALPKPIRLFLLHALQSAMFNRCVAERIRELGAIHKGDLAWLHGRGAVFEVTDPSAQQPRADAFEISPSGPLFGHRMKAPSGRQADIEQRVLDEFSVSPANFASKDALRIRGERRPLRVPVLDAAAQQTSDALILRFTLPPGSYATTALREIQKT